MGNGKFCLQQKKVCENAPGKCAFDHKTRGIYEYIWPSYFYSHPGNALERMARVNCTPNA